MNKYVFNQKLIHTKPILCELFTYCCTRITTKKIVKKIHLSAATSFAFLNKSH